MMSRHFDGELRMLSGLGAGLGTGLGSGVGTDSSGSGSGLGLVDNSSIGGMRGPLKPDQHFKTILQLMVGAYDADDETIAVSHSQPLPLPIHLHTPNHDADNTIINNTTKTNLTSNSSVDNMPAVVTGTSSNSDA